MNSKNTYLIALTKSTTMNYGQTSDMVIVIILCVYKLFDL
jgi:hypothetical protein